MEQMPNTFTGLFWGYTAIWVLIAAFILRLGLRVAKIEKRLQNRDSSNI